jgi:hypothetical protein
MARVLIDTGVSKKVLPMCLGERCYQLLDELAWSARMSKAAVVRTLIEKAASTDLQKGELHD